MPSNHRVVLITGAAHRIGKAYALAVARSGADVILHFAYADDQAHETAEQIRAYGRQVWTLAADFSDPLQAGGLVDKAWGLQPFDAVVNNAAIFANLDWQTTTLADWQRHLDVNLTAPFLISQAFAKRLGNEKSGRIINILDWRALRPGADHLAYTISKAGLLALTQALAVAMAPNITVNGLALGAILPPSDGRQVDQIIRQVPAGRWAELSEVEEALLFL